MEAQVDTLCILAQPKEGQQQILKQKTTRTDESPTTKELKKKHSPRPVGGVGMGSWGVARRWLEPGYPIFMCR